MGFLDGQVALVTGAGRGIGRAIAVSLAREGACVALIGRAPGPLQTAASALAAFGAETLTLPGDVSDESDVARVVTEATRRLGRVDILVNNAGFGIRAPLIETSLADWEQTMATNVRGPFLMCRALLPQMVERRSGHVVNVISGTAKTVKVNTGSYAASKAALLQLTFVTALEMKAYGVHVNAVSPGLTDTEMGRAAAPHGRFDEWLTPEDVAAVVSFVVSPAAAGLYGACVEVPGR